MTLFCLTHVGALNSWLFHIGGAAPVAIITPSAEDSFENKGLLLAIGPSTFLSVNGELTFILPLGFARSLKLNMLKGSFFSFTLPLFLPVAHTSSKVLSLGWLDSASPLFIYYMGCQWTLIITIEYYLSFLINTLFLFVSLCACLYFLF